MTMAQLPSSGVRSSQPWFKFPCGTPQWHDDHVPVDTNRPSQQNPPPYTNSVATSASRDASAVAPADLENRLHQTLNYYNKLAKNLDINGTPPENVATHEIEAAKMLNYCVRMLHADGWVSAYSSLSPRLAHPRAQ